MESASLTVARELLLDGNPSITVSAATLTDNIM
jgi:hypothetical protein